MTRWFRAGLLGAAVMVVPTLLAAQTRQGFATDWERTGRDFSPDGVWRPKARSVSRTRANLLKQGDMPSLNAPMRAGGATPSAAAITGTLRVPAILFSFANTVIPEPFPVGDYNSALFALSPPAGRPYTLRTFYEQMSNGLFSIQGTAANWARLKNPESSYTGAPGACAGLSSNGNCNGIWSDPATALFQAGLAEAIDSVDGTVDFAQFDNNGPDGIPNSGDDDGFVDVVLFLQAEMDGACQGATNNHPWAHRYYLLAGKTTLDARTGGGFIRIRDYIVQSAVGGADACTTSQLMAPGTAAHELGHALGLPDLYDTGNINVTEGIGQWGLMGSGNYTSAFSPSRMEAWSLNEMGWITLRPITTGGSYTLGPAPTSDTAFVITPAGANPRGQRYLIENRQPVQSDTALIRIHCARSLNPAGCGGGLLIWHIDQTKFNEGGRLNNGAIHALELVQADNLQNLRKLNVTNGNGARGDAGDPYPGITNNTSFSPTSAPAARLNNTAYANGASAGFAIDQIQINGQIASFRYALGGTYRVNANDPAVSIQVDNTTTTLFNDLLIDGTTHTLSVTSPQLSNDGRRRFSFSSWTDGGLQTHNLVASVAGDTITATMSREFKVVAAKAGNGTIASTPSVDLTGAFIAQASPLQLVATPDIGEGFVGWTGDTSSTNTTLVLPMGRPYNLTATFSAPVSISTGNPLTAGVMGTPYTTQLAATGGTGAFTWSVTAGALPQGVTLSTAGLLAGTPAVHGDFGFTVQAASGALTGTLDATISVTAPVLNQSDVVNLALGASSALTQNDRNYLDLLGNKNGGYDLGDFLAWVRETGATGALRQLEAAQRAAQTRTAKEK